MVEMEERGLVFGKRGNSEGAVSESGGSLRKLVRVVCCSFLGELNFMVLTRGQKVELISDR